MDRLPDGWSTPAGGDGAALSGGERQRLLLAGTRGRTVLMSTHRHLRAGQVDAVIRIGGGTTHGSTAGPRDDVDPVEIVPDGSVPELVPVA